MPIHQGPITERKTIFPSKRIPKDRTYENGSSYENVNPAVQEQAMKESEAYFFDQQMEADHLMHDKETELMDLVACATPESPCTINDVKKAVGEPIMHDGIALIICKAVNACARELRNRSQEEQFSLMTAAVHRLLDPVTMLAQAQVAFVKGESWYHTTAKGQQRFKEIVEEN